SKKSVAEKLQPAMEPDPENPRRQLVNVEKADEIFKKTNDPSQYIGREEKGSPVETDAYSAQRADLTRLNVEKSQIELAQMKGQLLNKEEVIQACAKWGQSVRDKVTASARTFSETAGTMTDAREIKTLFEKE